MAKLDNVLMKIFGSGAGLNQISKFGSLFAGTPEFTTDPAAAQSLSNFLTGWAAAAIGGNSPAIEDMNALFFVMAYQLAYYQQAGVPEWNAGKTYYIGSLVNDGNGAIYVSKTDGNVNNLVTDASYWTLVSGKVMDTLGDIIYGGVDGALTKLSGNTTTTLQVLTQLGTGSGSAAPAWRDFKAPTIQKFTSGSGTYTRPDGVMYIRVRMVGGGGGGQGGGTGQGSTGGTGGNTTFGTSLLIANGAAGPVGGSVTLNSPAIGTASQGGQGQGYMEYTGAAGHPTGSQGAASPFGGAGAGVGTGAGVNGITNSGSGGGGGGGNVAAGTVVGGSGGGAGGFIDAIIPSPASTYSYAVGSGGAGTAGVGVGSQSGGNGGSGYIEVTEYYQ